MKKTNIAVLMVAGLVSTVLGCVALNKKPSQGSRLPSGYGSNDDTLSLQFHKALWNPNNFEFFSSMDQPHSQSRSMQLQGDDPELAGYRRYLAGRASHPRFKNLPPQFAELGLADNQRGKPFRELDFSTQASRERERYKAHYSWPSRPNLFLQNALIAQNQQRILAPNRVLMSQSSLVPTYNLNDQSLYI